MISIITAVDNNFLIGSGNKLPWPNLPADMNFFSEKTKGKTVIMGSNTYWSLPNRFRPLPSRDNIILSRRGNKILKPFGHVWIGKCLPDDIKSIIASLSDDEEHFVIGGAEIYRLFLEDGWVNQIYLTRIDGNFQGDVHFPKEHLECARMTMISHQRADNENPYNLHFFRYDVR